MIFVEKIEYIITPDFVINSGVSFCFHRGFLIGEMGKTGVEIDR